MCLMVISVLGWVFWCLVVGLAHVWFWFRACLADGVVVFLCVLVCWLGDCACVWFVGFCGVLVVIVI